MTHTGETATSLMELRREVRDLVSSWLDQARFRPSCDSWLRSYDQDFSRALGERGLIGVSWPEEYGGSERAGIARLVITEELLRVGAPVAAHWIADRQIGPAILRYGNPTLKERYLRGIASGDLTFCLGMSETEAGSDLASVRTRAARVGDGWQITGRKIWTSQAHRSTHAYVLARTESGEHKHEGLTEFIVDMSAPGVDVRPIYDLRGEHHFNEVTFDEVEVADDHVLGDVGNGWQQVTKQLSLERGGIERVLSTYPLLAESLQHQRRSGAVTGPVAAQVGEVLARLATLRAMAVDVALEIDAGESPVVPAAILKDLGTAFEGDVNEVARKLLNTEPDPTDDGASGLLAQGILAAPGFTIRGGTSEVLKTLIARGVGDLLATCRRERGEVSAVADDVLDGAAAECEDQDGIRRTVIELGWLEVAVAEHEDPDGGTLADVSEIVEGLGRNAVSAPVAEHIVAARTLRRAGLTEESGAAGGHLSVALGGDVTAVEEGEGFRLMGRSTRVPWGTTAQACLVEATTDREQRVLALVHHGVAGVEWKPAVNVGGEPRDDIVLDDALLTRSMVLPFDERAAVELSLLRSGATLGAMESALRLSLHHVSTREQFGRPLVKFQAVAGLLATMASEFALARVAHRRAVAALVEPGPEAWTRVAVSRAMMGQAATQAARISHQLHAAMGITREHQLHLLTRRMWAWRDESGTQLDWSERLGEHLLALTEDEQWAWLTTGGVAE